jgi:hypothetical protein
MEKAEAGGELLSTVHVNSREYRRRRRKQKERRRRRRRGKGRAEAGDELRELLSIVLCLCSNRRLLLLLWRLYKILCL